MKEEELKREITFSFLVENINNI